MIMPYSFLGSNDGLSTVVASMPVRLSAGLACVLRESFAAFDASGMP
jgi:hypothetical protein